MAGGLSLVQLGGASATALCSVGSDGCLCCFPQAVQTFIVVLIVFERKNKEEMELLTRVQLCKVGRGCVLRLALNHNYKCFWKEGGTCRLNCSLQRATW